MKTYKIALYPGDGIGLDVTAEAAKVMNAAAAVCGFMLDMHEFDWGHRYWKKTGKVVPDDFLEQLKPHDAIFLGAIGDPANVPDHVSLKPLIDMRQQFDQYACVRPAKLLAGIKTPLAGRTAEDIDITIIRENSEGEYIDAGGMFKLHNSDGSAMQLAVHTRKGVERVLRYGFEFARKSRNHLTMATKSNALKYSMVLWDTVFSELQKEYQDVQSDKCHVDALAMNFVLKPQFYDVVVASNLFGDILSDIGGAISGSLGLAPSANINPSREFPSLFEPVHGSAPDIAGKGIANPLAAIRSGAMMLDFLGQTQASRIITAAIEDNLLAGTVLTPDIGGKSTTSDVGDDIAQRIYKPA